MPKGRVVIHLLSDLNEEARTATCCLCGFVRVYKNRSNSKQLWSCSRHLPDRKPGVALGHVLTEIDEEIRTAMCAGCNGRVQVVWKFRGRGQTSSEGRFICTHRSAVSKMRHSLTDIDEELRSAQCLICGPVKIHWQGRNDGRKGCWACGEKMKKFYAGSTLTIKQNYREALAKEQDSKCRICSRTLEVMFVDHNHATGLIRGGLCRACNTGLGQFQDDPERMAIAAEYIKEHNALSPEAQETFHKRIVEAVPPDRRRKTAPSP